MPSIIGTGSTGVLATRLDEIDQTCRRGLYLIAMRALGEDDEAREAVQEVLARAVEAIRADRVPAHVPLPCFVHGIARHVLADAIRLRVQRTLVSLETQDHIASMSHSALDAIVAMEERQHLALALQRLPDDDRELLRRCYVDGEGLVEIARSSGEPDHRIRKRKSRALDRLRSLMGVRSHDSPPQATDRA